MDDLRGIPLADLLREVEGPTAAPDPGEEYLTPEQWAAVWGCSLDKAQHSVTRLVRAGIMEMSRREGLNIVGHRSFTPVYRIVPGKVKQE